MRTIAPEDAPDAVTEITIDFEKGDDRHDGRSKAQPWQHHPWDPAATGAAAAGAGLHTYVFKRGSVYRGTLIAKDSGAPGNPIRLTVDPAWGRDRAPARAAGQRRLNVVRSGVTPCERLDTGSDRGRL